MGWTIARTALIAPGILAMGVPVVPALTGSLISSMLISTFTVMRIYGATQKERHKTLSGCHSRQRHDSRRKWRRGRSHLSRAW